LVVPVRVIWRVVIAGGGVTLFDDGTEVLYNDLDMFSGKPAVLDRALLIDNEAGSE